MVNFIIALAAIIGTFIFYLVGLTVHQRWNYTFTAPVIIATIAIVSILFLFNISYETYMIGGDWINELLGPAVVALAYPLYQQRVTLKKLMLPVLTGTVVGAMVGILSGILLAKWVGFEEFLIYSLAPKSVTTPVAMEVATTLEGEASLAAVFVMIAGIGGVTLSSLVFKYTRMDHYIGRGVGIGSGSHAIGTATAMEHSQLEGSVSTIAMVVSAIVVSVIAPWMVMFFL
ncbi:LrgB family protein [Virgibacillus sp. NKC19-3]|uniref:LrgB family protein n=1 Tax=Virgibacillus saliphilus TaxID=2831674 RepID=UPI001C9B9962|nr:LrgB family protein [Virgibacillus sp. NKC19-3]MBY7145018.1 LrgB family protein [Virgibacillus sp. NKC19-3]